MSRPFIIWTLQRTGGTNLTQRLLELSGLPGTQHEPFNLGRAYGHITRHWLDTTDRAALDAAVEEIVGRGVVIKHCVETVPWDVSESLIRASAKAGYEHLFLYRRNALDRLLSLHFAQQTGVWGPGQQESERNAVAKGSETAVDSAAEDSATFAQALPVDVLVEHERRCVALLNRTWNLICTSGASPMALAYEDIYAVSDPGQSLCLLAPVLAKLGLADDDAQLDSWVKEVIGRGYQGTREKYSLFPGVDELKKQIEALAPFMPDAAGERILWRSLAGGHPWIQHFFIDVLPSEARVGEALEVGGVLVLSREAPAGARLEMASAARAMPLQWSLPSQKIARQFPQGGNSAQARWNGRISFLENECCLAATLVAPDGLEIVVGEILRMVPEDYKSIYREPGDRLIYDIGANDGADTWYYLRKGFRVVAVEAIPDLAENLCTVFSAQIEAGRLVVEQKAVVSTPGEIEITINEERTEWSSAHKAPKAFAGKHRVVAVPAVTLASLIERHGRPYYVKIDIEGGEQDAVHSLKGLPADALPPYLSVETNQQIFEVLQMLWDLGYREFQLVRQGAPFLPPPPSPAREGLDYRCAFTFNMSGPFGRDLPEQNWVALVEIIRNMLEVRQAMKESLARGENPGWYDVHARYNTASS